MKKGIIILTLVTVTVTGMMCKPKQEAEIKSDGFHEIVLSHLNDEAFKQTASIKIYALNVLDVDTVTLNTIDEALRSKALDRHEHFKALADVESELLKISNKQARLYSKLGSKTLVDNANDDSRESLEKVKSDKDSARYYLYLDSLIAERITKNKNPDTAFRIKVFLKATQKSRSDSTNVLDTLYYYADKNKKVIDLSIIK